MSLSPRSGLLSTRSATVYRGAHLTLKNLRGQRLAWALQPVDTPTEAYRCSMSRSQSSKSRDVSAGSWESPSPVLKRETSAGGLVLDRIDPAANILLIARCDRRGRLMWSFPKGHVEEGETYRETACREVTEETGVTAQILLKLGEIDFYFNAGRDRIHKTVHHYLMVWESGDLSDADPEVESVSWVSLDKVANRLAYSDERALTETAQRKITGLTA